MNFEDEHYVRIYTRDTKTWKRWTWEARCLFSMLWRKLDKAGLMEDIEDPVEDVALMTELPVEVVEVGLPQLIKSGTIRMVNGYLIGVNYIDGQTAKKSDKVRAKESRERRAGLALLSQIVTDRHETGETVTPCDESERDVTSRDSVTIRDGADTNRDPPSQSVTERHDNPSSRHSTQSNAVQRNAATATAVGEQQRLPSSMAEAIPIPIRERAQLMLENGHASWLTPHKWPELIAVATASNRARGLAAEPRLTSYPQDNTRQLVELFAAGYTQEQLETAVRTEWWTSRKNGLSSLSTTVVDRALAAEQAQQDPDAERRRREREQLESDRAARRAARKAVAS